MVGRAREPMARRGDPVQGAGELGPVGHEEREMKETRRAARAQRSIRILDERHERDLVVGRSQLHETIRAAELA